MSVFSGPEIINDGLVLHLDATNSKSYPGTGSTWFDLSGRGNNANLTVSPTYSTNYFQFGSNTYAEIPPSSSLVISQPSIISVCTVSGGAVFARGAYGSFWNFGLVNITAGTPGSFGMRNNNSDLSRSANLTAGSVRMFGAAATGSSDVFYLDGSNIDVTTTNYSPSATLGTSVTGRTTIGAAYNNGTSLLTDWYAGRVYQIMVYNRRLSDLEMQQNFEALRGRFNL